MKPDVESRETKDLMDIENPKNESPSIDDEKAEEKKVESSSSKKYLIILNIIRALFAVSFVLAIPLNIKGSVSVLNTIVYFILFFVTHKFIKRLKKADNN